MQQKGADAPERMGEAAAALQLLRGGVLPVPSVAGRRFHIPDDLSGTPAIEIDDLIVHTELQRLPVSDACRSTFVEDLGKPEGIHIPCRDIFDKGVLLIRIPVGF